MGGRLRAKQIGALRPGRHGDGGTLFLVVEPGGWSRQWVQRLTVHGKRRDLGLGGYQYVGLAEAAAFSNRQLARRGGEPTRKRSHLRSRAGRPGSAPSRRVRSSLGGAGLSVFLGSGASPTLLDILDPAPQSPDCLLQLRDPRVGRNVDVPGSGIERVVLRVQQRQQQRPVREPL